MLSMLSRRPSRPPAGRPAWASKARKASPRCTATQRWGTSPPPPPSPSRPTRRQPGTGRRGSSCGRSGSPTTPALRPRTRRSSSTSRTSKVHICRTTCRRATSRAPGCGSTASRLSREGWRGGSTASSRSGTTTSSTQRHWITGSHSRSRSQSAAPRSRFVTGVRWSYLGWREQVRGVSSGSSRMSALHSGCSTFPRRRMNSWEEPRLELERLGVRVNSGPRSFSSCLPPAQP
mmetsp:Transcript_25862/g.73082  ORF Transcript_25862/g.73082 Transcript_25862/m.73082 type:complete len:233 (-) Transcript_25862:143-841(-)